MLNVPLALAALVMLISFLPDVKAPKGSGPLDVIGLVLLVAWLASLQIVLSRGEIVHSGSAKAIAPDEIYEKYLGIE